MHNTTVSSFRRHLHPLIAAAAAAKVSVQKASIIHAGRSPALRSLLSAENCDGFCRALMHNINRNQTAQRCMDPRTSIRCRKHRSVDLLIAATI